VRLSSASVDWLAEQCGASADASDLEQTYAFSHPLNGTRSLKREELQTEAPSFLRWWVEITTPAGERLLEMPLARMVYAEHVIHSNPGRLDHVAYNAAFYVERKFQRQGLATVVYPAEENLYRKWNIAEVQLHALGDGCVVWLRKFGFQLKDAEVYAADYPAWARMNGKDPTVPTSAAGYPDAFLRSRTELHAYKVLR